MSEVNPNRSNLDQNQILQRTFDEDQDRLRVDTKITASIAVLEVYIDALSSNPPDNILIVGSEDGTASGTKHVAKVNASGSLTVDASQSGTWTVGRTWTLSSGTDSVASVQGTSPWITKDQADGPVTPGTVASFSQLAGGQYNFVLPTLVDTQQCSLQLDSSGRLIISPVTISGGSITINGGVHTDNFPATVDTNYGIVGASTPRSASQIGNATGAADFNTGITTAQTLRVVLPTDQTSIPVTQSGTWNLNDITGTVSLPTGAATETTLASILDGLKSTTSSVTSVSASATNVTLLASNASRKGASFYNDSVAICYLKLGATASSTSYTVQLDPRGIFFIEGIPVYTGIIDALWASATGSMRITELT